VLPAQNSDANQGADAMDMHKRDPSVTNAYFDGEVTAAEGRQIEN